VRIVGRSSTIVVVIAVAAGAGVGLVSLLAVRLLPHPANLLGTLE
jgi:hypothetical protein